MESKPSQSVSLREKRENHRLAKEKTRRENKRPDLIQGDYQTRGLDFCYFCGDKFNVGEKIPRILIHCGHTFCTECLS